MLNQCVMIGRLVRDPELNYTGSGTPVSNFTLAVERNFTNKEGDREVDFIPVVVWQKLAETVSQHLEKGRLVAVTGRLQIRKSDKGGRTYINPEIVANNVRFLDWGDKKDSQGSQADNYDDMMDDDFDVPF